MRHQITIIVDSQNRGAPPEFRNFTSDQEADLRQAFLDYGLEIIEPEPSSYGIGGGGGEALALVLLIFRDVSIAVAADIIVKGGHHVLKRMFGDRKKLETRPALQIDAVDAAAHIRLPDPRDLDSALSLLTDVHEAAIREGLILPAETPKSYEPFIEYTDGAWRIYAGYPRRVAYRYDPEARSFTKIWEEELPIAVPIDSDVLKG